MVRLVYKLKEDESEKFLFLTKKAKVCIVCFSAQWCGPCKMLAERLPNMLGNLIESDHDFNDFTNLHDSVVLVKVDIDEHEDLAQLYEVSGIPHTIFYNNGKLMPNVIKGCQPDKIVDVVHRLCQ